LEDLPAPAVVVGHSFGGKVAVHLAAGWPQQVRALVLTGAPLVKLATGRKPALRYRVGRALHRHGVVSEEAMERLRQRYGSPDYRAAQGIMRAVHVVSVNERFDDQLRAVRCPAELVWGDDDVEVPVAMAEAAAALLGDATITLCPGAGHMVPLTAPDALRAAVERQLR
jgi:pimeloyl-ACP methyl ester carboxylesterase